MLLPRLLRGTQPGKGFETLVTRINAGLERSGKWEPIPLIMAFGLALILVFGPYQNGLFGVLRPSALQADGAEEWLRSAYSSWWASNDHPAGYMLYIAIATLGIFVVFLQNIVGGFCIYFLGALNAVAEPDADWLNRDGAYGWMPIALVFRTVRWSLVLHGSTLAVAIIMVGFKDFPGMYVLVGIWLIVLPTYLIVPRFVFRHVQTRSRDRRIQVIDTQREDARVDLDDALAIEPFRAAVERVHHVKIRPLRMRPAGWPVFIVVVLLPILLTVAQIVASVQFGGN
jgi:hypothetical protein